MTTTTQLKREIETFKHALNIKENSVHRLRASSFSDVEKQVVLTGYQAIKTPVEQRTQEQQQAVNEADLLCRNKLCQQQPYRSLH